MIYHTHFKYNMIYHTHFKGFTIPQLSIRGFPKMWVALITNWCSSLNMFENDKY